MEDSNTNKKRNKQWRIIVIAALTLTILAFSPLVLKPGKIEPTLLSMPFTLWVSIVITIVLVILTYIGGRIYLKDRN